MNIRNLLWLFVMSVLPFGNVASAGSIKTWSTNETVRSSDLNATFQHIHNNMVGGHGARLINSDISAGASIEHSKLQRPALVPKAWAMVGTQSAPCAGGAAAGTACTVNDSSQVSSAAANGTTGQYRVTLSYTPANANFIVMLTPLANTDQRCTVGALSTAAPHFVIYCWGAAVSTNLDIGVGFVVFDS